MPTFVALAHGLQAHFDANFAHSPLLRGRGLSRSRGRLFGGEVGVSHLRGGVNHA